MRTLSVTPKNGWKNATNLEMQKQSCNMIGAKHCMNPTALYDLFNKLNIYLPPVMHVFMGATWEKANTAMLDAFFSEKTDTLIQLIEKTNQLKPKAMTPQEKEKQQRYVDFCRELKALSEKYGIVIKSVGGVTTGKLLSVQYDSDLDSGDLIPISTDWIN